MGGAAFLAVIAAMLVFSADAVEHKRICYFSNWAQYRPLDGQYFPRHIDPSLCTHVIFGFAYMEGNLLIPYEWNDDIPGGLYQEMNALKTAQNGLKTLLAVGGWNFGMERASAMMSSKANRAEFIAHTIAFCRQHNFDGFDLDFEYPGVPDRGSRAEDRAMFTELVKEMRAAYDLDAEVTKKPKLLLTAAVGAGKKTIDVAYDIDIISQHLDWIGLMAYDLNGAWDDFTGQNAPLYGRVDEIGTETETLNVDFAARYWVEKGCPAEKLIIGLATYGRCYTLASTANTGLGAPAIGPCKNGTYTREAGFLSYYEICDAMKLPGAVTIYDTEQQVPYTYHGDQWIGFDNVQSIDKKVKYMVDGGYGGYMVWNLDLDDFTGTHCGAGTYPLMRTMMKSLSAAVAAKTTTGTASTAPTPTTPSTTPTAPTTTESHPTTPTTPSTTETQPTTPTTPSTTETQSTTPTTHPTTESSTASTPTTTTAATTPSTTPLPAEPKRVCYVSNWAQYRPADGVFKPPNIDASLCTHLIYAFAYMKGNRLEPYEWNDDGPGNLYEQLNSWKARYPSLKTLIAVGGWNMEMHMPSAMMSSAANRKEFIEDSIEFCRTRNFDGLDLDFEYPGRVDLGSRPEDKQLFTKLVQEARAAYEAEAAATGQTRLLLTAAVGAGKATIDNGYEIAEISQSLDAIHLMSYDLNGAWDNQTGHNAPLYARDAEIGTERETLNVDYATRRWLDGGCPKEKLIVGVATYGRCFTLTNSAQNGLGAPVKGPCLAGTYTREEGFLSYYEICNFLKNPNTVKVYDTKHLVPYAHLFDQWVGFDDELSLNEKIKYIKDRELGGWMVWNMDLDDFGGVHCGAGDYPLIKSLNQAFLGFIPSQSFSTITTTKAPTTPYTGPSTTPTIPPGGSGFCADKQNGLHKNPESCASYYNCFSGNGQLMECGLADLVFDADKGYCNYLSEVSPERRAECTK